MSTIFLKQHSLLDVLAGTALAIVLYYLVYEVDYKRVFSIKCYNNSKFRFLLPKGRGADYEHARDRKKMAKDMGGERRLQNGTQRYRRKVLRFGNVPVPFRQFAHGARPQLFHRRRGGAV